MVGAGGSDELLVLGLRNTNPDSSTRLGKIYEIAAETEKQKRYREPIDGGPLEIAGAAGAADERCTQSRGSGAQNTSPTKLPPLRGDNAQPIIRSSATRQVSCSGRSRRLG